MEEEVESIKVLRLHSGNPIIIPAPEPAPTPPTLTEEERDIIDRLERIFGIRITENERLAMSDEEKQEIIKEYCPKNGTCVIKETENISEQGLEGTLDLSDFKNLEELRCYNNCLTTLNLSNLEQLEILWCSDNYLTQIPYIPNPEKITHLCISNNNINPSDLTIFKPLKDLNKLEDLDISNTDIDSGWEYLPDSLETFYYKTDLRPNYLGLKPDEYNFANYLKNERNLTPQQAKEYNLSELKKDYDNFLASKQSEEKINQFIQEAQVEKIPYEQFSYITYLAEGGFVVLKNLNNSSNITPEFLHEIASHKLFDGITVYDETKIIKCHGISQDPETKNYVMVMDYVRGGNLRDYLQKNNKKLDLKKKLIQLQSIAEGLEDIHDKGLVHKDFHLGNILKLIQQGDSGILGLTIPREPTPPIGNKEEELQKRLEKAQQKVKKWENKARQLQTQLEELQAQIQIPPKNN
ncbi:19080_t:CDS:2 [Racocetra fulgida]|uniref:19080_t:CDS:1 n=1 Tax=Racocetra fulgida TaxID=60492 RepID=A0A9N8VYV7_9GLOM|nr:19080_t:CDS:2 [Racocetra fulgida]